MVRSMSWKMALVAVGAFAGFASHGDHSFAQDSEAVVRISDHGQSGQHNHGQVSQYGGYSQGGCQNCESGQCGYHGCTMRPHGYINHALGWLNPWSGVGTYSPDHGYAPPGKVRTPHPQQVAYNKAFPDAWTGQPGAGGGGQRAAQIYMPTDTTQLGYYYQAAPRWHANPNMVPPTPVPSQWHRDLCQDGHTGQHGFGLGHGGFGNRSGYGQGQYCRGNSCPPQYSNGEQIISEQVIDQNSQPSSSNPTPVLESVPSSINTDPAPPSIPSPIPLNTPTATPLTPPAAVPLQKVGYPNLTPIR